MAGYDASSAKGPCVRREQVEALWAAVCEVTEAAQPCSVRHVYYLDIRLLWDQHTGHLPELLGRLPSRLPVRDRLAALGADFFRIALRTRSRLPGKECDEVDGDGPVAAKWGLMRFP